MEKLMRWREMAQKMQGHDFWSSIFNQDATKDLMPDLANLFEANANFPRADVYKRDLEIIVLVEVPGLRKHDLQLTIAGDRLTVKGTVPAPYPKHVHVATERFYGPFERTIMLPEIVQREGASAKFNEGLLEIRLPRDLNAAAKNIKIE